MGDLQHQLAEVRTELRTGFSAVNRRIDEARLEMRERDQDGRKETRELHRENVQRLGRIEDEVKRTNGNVIRHDEQIVTLFKKVDDINKVGDAVERAPLTTKSAGVWLAFALVCIGATWFVLTTVIGFHR